MKKIQVCGHRGFPEKYPQNTLPSFEAAVQLGCDRIEYDLHWTADHRIVVCHNASIDETSNGKGEIASMTFEELRKYDFGSWKSEQFAGTPIPAFEEVLELTNAKNPHLFHLVELKVDSLPFAETVAEELLRRNMTGRFTLVSFHLDLLKEMKRRHPEILIHGNPDCALETFNYEDYRMFDSVGLWRDRVTPEVVRGFHAVGTQVDAWTIDNEDEFLKQQENGVDSVTSNNPECILNCAERIRRV